MANHAQSISQKFFSCLTTAALLLLGAAPANAVSSHQVAKLLASDGAANDFFGYHLALSGNTAVIGAFRDDDDGGGSGSAYVFVNNGGIWTEQAKLTASDASGNDRFGHRVAILGDTIIVGARREDENGPDAGAAYVFTRTGDVWTEQDKLLASDAGGRFFGGSIAIDGDTANISGYIFVRNTASSECLSGTVDSWCQQAKLTPGSGSIDDAFGIAVSISGDTAMVGAYLDDDNGIDAGAAYVYTRSGTTWTEQAKLTAGGAGDWFGVRVSVSGDTALVAAPNDDEGGVNRGAAYVFTRTGGVWNQQAKLMASDAVDGLQFSFGLHLDGDRAVVSANNDAINGDESGSAYVFTRSGTVWSEAKKITPCDGAARDRFAWEVALDGDALLVGAPASIFGTWTGRTGFAYVFDLNNDESTPNQIAKLMASDGDFAGATGDFFGWSVALSGDTAVIGPWRESNENGSRAGAAYVYQRNACIWTQQARLIPDDNAANDRLGESVEISGDTIVVGAYRADLPDGQGGSLTDAGAAYVYERNTSGGNCLITGNADPWCQTFKVTASDPKAFDLFGSRYTVLAGDTLVVGVSRHDDDVVGADVGAVYVFERNTAGASCPVTGTADAWCEQAKLMPSDAFAGMSFGAASLSGNTLVVGATGDVVVPGAIYVYARNTTGSICTISGAADPWCEQTKLTPAGATPGDGFGGGVTISNNTIMAWRSQGEVNGFATGLTHVFRRNTSAANCPVTGTPDAWCERGTLTASDGAAGDFFGFASIFGDTAIITADATDDAGQDSGSAYVFVRNTAGANCSATGTPDAWCERSKFSASDAMPFGWFGASTVLLGDTVLVGSPTSAFNPVGPGAAYVFDLNRSATPTGGDVVVSPVPVNQAGEPVEDAPSISLEFASVDSGGDTSVTVSDEGPPLPTGFKLTGLSGGPTYFDIQTSADFTPPVEICIDYSDLTVAGNPADLVFAHEVGGVWTDITSSNDTANMILCGMTNSFSFFALLEVTDPLTLLPELYDLVAAINMNNGLQNSLDSKLDAVANALSDSSENNNVAAYNVLTNAFINSVEAQRGKKLSDAEADLLIAKALEIALVLEGLPSG